MGKYSKYAVALPAFVFFVLAGAPAVKAQDMPNMSMPVHVVDTNPAQSRAVKYGLGQVRELDTPDIQVVSDGHTVKLMGYVTSKAERQQAEDIARDVPGVDRVINDLWIRNWVRKGDHSE